MNGKEIYIFCSGWDEKEKIIMNRATNIMTHKDTNKINMSYEGLKPTLEPHYLWREMKSEIPNPNQ